VGNESNWIVVYPSRWKAFFYLLVSLLALVAAGGLLFTLDARLNVTRFKEIVASGFLTVVGALAAAAGVYRLFTRQPLLVINEEGVFYKASPGVNCLLRWNEIRRVEVFRYQVGVFLRFVPVNPADLLKQQGLLAKFQRSLTPSELTDALNVPQEMLSTKVAELADQINQRYGSRLVRERS
jgi:hypothetical protein